MLRPRPGLSLRAQVWGVILGILLYGLAALLATTANWLAAAAVTAGAVGYLALARWLLRPAGGSA